MLSRKQNEQLLPSSPLCGVGTNGGSINGRSITTLLELGAGCGLVGMGLASLGLVDHAIVTDRDVTWLYNSVEANAVTTRSMDSTVTINSTFWFDHGVEGDDKECEGDGRRSSSVTVVELEWGKAIPQMVGVNLPLPQQFKQHYDGDANTTTFSSTTTIAAEANIMKPTRRALDYIVGSDLLYHPESYDDLLCTLDSLTSYSEDDHTQIVLAYPERVADGEMIQHQQHNGGAGSTRPSHMTTTQRFSDAVLQGGTFRIIEVYDLSAPGIVGHDSTKNYRYSIMRLTRDRRTRYTDGTK